MRTGRSARCSVRRGFSLIEAATASLVLGLLAAATLSAVSASSNARLITSDRARARHLAGSLLAEICAQSYAEPGSTTLGMDAGENLLPSRLMFDDVDDYAGLIEAPPKQKDGTDLPGLTGWVRSTTVVWVSPTDLVTPSASESFAKLITVSVSKGKRKLAQATAVRTAAMDKTLWTGKTLQGAATASAVAPPGG